MMSLKLCLIVCTHACGVCLCVCCTYVTVVLLEEGQFLLYRLYLTLQLGFVQQGVIDDLLQTNKIVLHDLLGVLLRLQPIRGGNRSLGHAHHYFPDL